MTHSFGVFSAENLFFMDLTTKKKGKVTIFCVFSCFSNSWSFLICL